MEITNYDTYIRSKGFDRSHKAKSIYGLKQPFRLLCVGTTGSGKTNAVFELIFKHQHFHHIVYVAKDILEDKLQMLKEALNFDSDGEPLDDPPLELMTDEEFIGSAEESEPYDINVLDRKQQHLFVFDDGISYSNTAQKMITDVFIRGRKLGISAIYISHRYYEIPKKIRMNFSHAMLFRMPTQREKNMIVSEISQVLPPDIVREIYDEATQVPHHFLLVDLTIDPTKELCKHMRMNFAYFLCRQA